MQVHDYRLRIAGTSTFSYRYLESTGSIDPDATPATLAGTVQA